MTGAKKIIMLHGRGRKPEAAQLQELWCQSLAAGLQRDAPELLDNFAAVPTQMIYFADELQQFDRHTFDPKLDLANRQQALERLAALDKPRQFRRRSYDELPGKTALKEFVMDVSAVAGLSAASTNRALPELKHYWGDENFKHKVREALLDTLKQCFANNEDVLLLSHCIGSVVAYDVLWLLGHEHAHSHRVSQWLTFGSPLGSRYVQGKLQGRKEQGARKYPVNVVEWHNISAEDDYVCHDKTVADDFVQMLEQRLIGGISDHTIYNLAVRYGRSNPHSSVGYLVHPRTTRCLAEWLSSDT
ncbi:MAG: hypothetical protein AAF993_07860 [Pseudomonadota bacterium]